MRFKKMTAKSIALTVLMTSMSFINATEVKFIENQEFFKDSSGIMREQDSRIPIIVSDNINISNRINNHIKKIVNKYRCSPKSDLYFTSNVKLKNEAILSLKYSALYSCESMPNSSSFEGGITLSLQSGGIVKLKEQIASKGAYKELSNKVINYLNKSIQSKINNSESCIGPVFSGNYYLSATNITFVEFFSNHHLSFCEIEVTIPIIEMYKYLKQDSILSLEVKHSIEKELIRAHSSSLKYYRKNDLKKSIEVLHPYLGNNQFLKYNQNKEEIINIINDFAFFLDEAGHHTESIEILKYVILINPGRVVAYINLADALFESGEKLKAKIEYEKYITLMKKLGKKHKIPDRAFFRG